MELTWCLRWTSAGAAANICNGQTNGCLWGGLLGHALLNLVVARTRSHSKLGRVV
jgi:hypothetical protein